MEWLIHNWPAVSGAGGVLVVAVFNVAMVRNHSVILKQVRDEAKELNGSVDAIIKSVAACQSVQKLLVDGRIKPPEGE